jgi:hypothetical protein
LRAIREGTAVSRPDAIDQVGLLASIQLSLMDICALHALLSRHGRSTPITLETSIDVSVVAEALKIILLL